MMIRLVLNLFFIRGFEAPFRLFSGFSRFLILLLIHKQIFVKTHHGRDIPLTVDPEDTVLRAKMLMQDEQGHPLDQQLLIYKGKQLDDKLPLGIYGMEEEDTVHLVLRLQGGLRTKQTALKKDSRNRIWRPMISRSIGCLLSVKKVGYTLT